MELILPLDEMTITDKLSVMERLWDDLCRNAEHIPSPSGHEDILSAREKRVRKGRAQFVDLDELKKRTRKSIR